jgi:hypothetical protein
MSMSIFHSAIRGFATAACLILTGAAAPAQTLKTTPLPGLWEQEFKILVNGQDLMASMAQAREAMMKSMSPQQRAQMQAMLQQQGGGAPGKERECLTAKDVAEMADPKKALANSMKDQPECRSEIVSVTGPSVKYKGRCENPGGFTGDFTGEYTQVDAKNWKYEMQGKGKMLAQMPAAGGKPGAGGPVEMNMRGQGRWVSADCGGVKPGR